jgi:hypothetical protein
VEKRPLEEGVHRKLDEGIGLMWIFRISKTLEVVNRETRRGKFQWPFEEMRSETFKSGTSNRLWGRGEGEKRWRVGTQKEFQTEREEN